MLENLCGLWNKGEVVLGMNEPGCSQYKVDLSICGADPSDTEPRAVLDLSKVARWSFHHSESLGFYLPHHLSCLLVNVLLPSGKMAVSGYL